MRAGNDGRATGRLALQELPRLAVEQAGVVGLSGREFSSEPVRSHTVDQNTQRTLQGIPMLGQRADRRLQYEGVETFLRWFGYPDKSGKTDRINFGGRYLNGKGFHASTGLALRITGFDQASGKITQGGSVLLVVRGGGFGFGKRR